MNKIKSIICATSIGIMLFAQLMSPVSVYADDGSTPPPAEATEVIPTSPPTEEPIATDTPTEVPTKTLEATQEPLATDAPTEISTSETPVPDLMTPDASALSTEVPVETEGAATEPAEALASKDTLLVEEPTLLEVLEELPADTSIVVTDANNQTLPLATQDTSEVIQSADPFWCPEGAADIPGFGGCTPSYGSLGELIANESWNIYSNGTIYIEEGYIYESGPVVINGEACDWFWDASVEEWYWSCFGTNWSYYSLTLQGGWGGSSGSASSFDVPISILNWNNDVTVNDINILNSLQGGLLVTSWNSDTDVDINNVTVDGAIGYGLALDINGGNVNIQNSAFNNTQQDPYGYTYYPYGDGADIWNAGAVTITNSQFNANAYDGADIVNATGPVNIAGSQFHLNAIDGLYTRGGSDVNLTGSSFNSNGSIGANIGNVNTVTITGSEFNNNGLDGADVFDTGAVSINNSDFNSNAWDGIYTVNAGGITIADSRLNNNIIGGLDSYSPAQITVTNTEFTANPQYDIYAWCNTDPVNFISYHEEILLFADSFPTSPSPPVTIDISLNGLCAVDETSYQLHAGGSTFPYPNGLTRRNRNEVVLTQKLDTRGTKSGRSGSPVGRIYASSGRVKQEFTFNCDEQSTYPVNLPNGDKVEVVCPVRGVASISRLENTALPAPLPAGYTYASAFQLDISKNKEPLEIIDGVVQTELIPVLTEGGYIQASFVPTPLPLGKTFAVLYWDANTAQWIPLKDFVYGRTFKLFPENPDDARFIRNGVHVVSTFSGLRVEVATNFPGIFVLAQH